MVLNKGAALLFVYGSLMRGRRANGLLASQGARFKGAAALPGYALYHLGGFPGIRPHPGQTVLGEAWLVPEQAFPALDRYEGEGQLYRRVTADITLDSGERASARAYVYLRPVDEGSRIPLSAQPWRG